MALAGQQPVAPEDVPVQRIPLTEPERLANAIAAFKPTRVIHAGALTAVAACYQDPELARQCNVVATEAIAAAAERVGARLVFTSTDMVFRGDAAPYTETDAPDADSIYGQSKIAAEQVLVGRPGVVVVRIPLLYGFPTTPRSSTFRNQVAGLLGGEPLKMFHDEWRTSVSLRETAAMLVGVADSSAEGLWHLAGPERLSRLDLILKVADLLGAATDQVTSISRLSIESSEPRPEDLSLVGTRLAALLPDLAPQAMERRDVTPA